MNNTGTQSWNMYSALEITIINSLDGNGFPIYDDEGKTLLERVDFHELDLLSYCREQNIILDRIIACIPQVSG